MLPSVTAVMLTRNRAPMIWRAIRCFQKQTYQRKTLFIYDTSDVPMDQQRDTQLVCGSHMREGKRRTIGELRNHANGFVTDDIIVHWDDDDWSHPNRIAEQVALLQESKVQCVGYREMLFWDRRNLTPYGPHAWLYSSPSLKYLVGSSLCYWRRVWKERPFPDLPDPEKPNSSTEDTMWTRELKTKGISSLGDCVCHAPAKQHEPRMICSIHGANSQAYEVEKYPDSWRRVPQWDERVREIMEGVIA